MPFVVSGRVLNVLGEPFVNREVVAIHEASGATVTARTDAQGRYAIAVPNRPGPWEVKVIYAVSGGGELDLYPWGPDDNPDPFLAADGAVRNFVYTNGHRVYGTVDVGIARSDLVLDDSLELTLTPVVPNALGHTAPLILRPRASLDRAARTVPLGWYRVSAVQTVDGQTVPLLVSSTLNPTPAFAVEAQFSNLYQGEHALTLRFWPQD
ncbi:carboxypeptidase-like regulatory domain-containing protein [Deinococcus multiflagellatus]|uniref:Carboxypeptidase-like regulatory domain-containing protein n=1 Tax=Deinococcus multiflagellatus TaxID=1656887 RepID=A0ABW1ZQV7_9DEIO